MKGISELEESLNRLFGWHKARMRCFVRMILALLTVRTVNLQEMAVCFSSTAQIDSRYRRIRRFIAQVPINFSVLAQWLFRMLYSPDQKVYLAIDRTEWFFGRKKINVFMLSVTYEGLAIPLYWKCLSSKGTSNTQDRIELVNRFISDFGCECIAGLLADREFIGKGWLSYLTKNKIPFYIRIKSNTHLKFKRKKWRNASTLFSKLNCGENYFLPMSVHIFDQKLFIAGSRSLRGELMIVVTNDRPNVAIAIYLRRWEIENLFQGLKSRGFRFEDTHLTDNQRIDRLIAIMAVAFVWAHKVGEWQADKKPIPMKNFKISRRPQFSYFRYGLNFIRDSIIHINRSIRIFKQYLRLILTPIKQLAGGYT